MYFAGAWESASCLLTMLQASGFQGTVITVNTALLACTKVTWLEGVELLVQGKETGTL